MYTESTLFTRVPSFSEASLAFFQSGSLRKPAQAFVGGGLAGIGENVDEFLLGFLGIARTPEANDGHAVLLEQAQV